MSKRKFYILTEVSFIGGSLLAPGSIVTTDDLGKYVDPADGKEKQVRPGSTMVEVNEDGSPINDEAARKLQGAAGALVEVPINTAPTQAPGGVSLAANSLRTAPEGAADATIAMQENRDPTTGQPSPSVPSAITAGEPLPEAPTRRGGK